jgi:hypothetical protein
MATRAEYLAMCKRGAIALLERGNLKGAIASMLSDVKKSDPRLYDDTVLRELLVDALFSRNTPDQVRAWIDGFD